MGHTNSTVNYNLPQFVGTDKPSWLGDVNGAFLAIDTAIAAAKTEADSAAGGVAGLQTTVGSHTTQIGTLTDTVTAQGGTLNSVTALIGNGTPTTTDQTIIGAINEINAEVNKGIVSVTADGVKTYAQLLNELYALIDHSKLNGSSYIELATSNLNAFYHIRQFEASEIQFTMAGWVSTAASVQIFTLKSSGSTYTNGSNDNSSQVLASGAVLKLVY